MQLKKANIIKRQQTQYFAPDTMGYIIILKHKQFLNIGEVKIKSMVSKCDE